MDASTITLWTGPFPIEGVFDSVLLLAYFIEIHVLKSNTVDPDQTLRFVASDLGLQCLPMSLL